MPLLIGQEEAIDSKRLAGPGRASKGSGRPSSWVHATSASGEFPVHSMMNALRKPDFFFSMGSLLACLPLIALQTPMSSSSQDQAADMLSATLLFVVFEKELQQRFSVSALASGQAIRKQHVWRPKRCVHVVGNGGARDATSRCSSGSGSAAGLLASAPARHGPSANAPPRRPTSRI